MLFKNPKTLRNVNPVDFVRHISQESELSVKASCSHPFSSDRYETDAAIFDMDGEWFVFHDAYSILALVRSRCFSDAWEAMLESLPDTYFEDTSDWTEQDFELGVCDGGGRWLSESSHSLINGHNARNVEIRVSSKSGNPINPRVSC